MVPDETGYAFLAAILSIGDLSLLDASLLGLAKRTAAFIFPAVILIDLGVPPLLAVKVVSSLYGILSILMFVLIVKSICIKFFHLVGPNTRIQLITTLVILVFSALPSKLVWSSFGLRETAVEFYVLSFIWGVIKLQDSVSSKLRSFKKSFSFSFLIFIAGLMILLSRQEVFWLVMVSLVIPFILLQKNGIAKFLIPTTFMSGILGILFLLTPIETRIINGLEESPLKVESLVDTVVSQGPLNSLKNIEQIQKNRQAYANSRLQVTECANKRDESFQYFTCRLSNSAYLVFSFLFRPLIFFDDTSTSNQKQLASYENIFWAFLIFMTAYSFRFWKLSKDAWALLFPFASFTAAYIVAVSQFTGNLGTGFRHKSILLDFILMILYILALSREQVKPKSG